MQSLLRRNSLSSISPAASICDPFTTREPEGTFKVERSQEGNCRGGQPKGKQGEGQSKNKSSLPGKDLDGEKVQDRSMSELQHARSRSTSPARSGYRKQTVFEVLINKVLTFYFNLHRRLQTGFSCPVTSQRAVPAPPADQGEPQARSSAPPAAGGAEQGL